MENKLGAGIGGSIGLIKGVIMVVAEINFAHILDTAILAAVGAASGLIVTETYKFIKRKLNK